MDLLEVILGIGKEANELGAFQMAARAVVVYIAILAIVRLAKKRFMGRATAFDVIVGIVLGSVASRAITGNAPILPALGAALAIVGLHWSFSAIAVRWHRFGTFIKGSDRLLIRGGQTDQTVLHAAHMTSRDLEEALREQGVSKPEDVEEARLERNGAVSVIKAPKPKVLSVEVAAGVQTIKIELT
jgi:uncharacterized membrane protein YcaP (DUF421 family)